MEWWQAIVVFLMLLALLYAFETIGKGGGDPNHKDHNRRHGPF